MIILKKCLFSFLLIFLSVFLTSCSRSQNQSTPSQQIRSGCRHDFSQSSTLHKLVIQNKTLPCSVCKREIPPGTEWVSRCAAGTGPSVGIFRVRGCGYQRCLPCDLDEFRKSRGNYYHDKHIKPVDDAYASGRLTHSQYKLIRRQALNQVEMESEQDYGKSGPGFNFGRPSGGIR